MCAQYSIVCVLESDEEREMSVCVCVSVCVCASEREREMSVRSDPTSLLIGHAGRVQWILYDK